MKYGSTSTAKGGGRFTQAEIDAIAVPDGSGRRIVQGFTDLWFDEQGHLRDGEHPALNGQISSVRAAIESMKNQSPAAAPVELTEVPRWVCWHAEQHPGDDKPRKVPKSPHTGGNASVSNPDTWGTYEQAQQAQQHWQFTGIGYVFTKDANIVGVDLDNCFESASTPWEPRRLQPWAAEIVSSLDSYTELSPSGNGLHVWCKGSLPANLKTAHVEMYDNGRYFTFTGEHFAGTPATINGRQDELTAIYGQYGRRNAENGTGAENHQPGQQSTVIQQTRPYGQAALIDAIRQVSTAPEGDRNNTVFEQTAALVELANGGELARDEVERAMMAAALAAGLGASEAENTIKSAFKKVGEKSRTAPAPNGQAPAVVIRPTEIVNPMPMADLISQEFPPLKWLVESLIAQGHLVVLAGRPKGGKSWLVLQLAKCLDLGQPFIGRETTPAKVLLVVLEDGARRVHGRVKALQWQPRQAELLSFIPKFDGADGGPGPGLIAVADHAKSYDIIIIDTLIASLSGAANENDNVQMAAILNELARIAHDTETAIVLVHHTNKAVSDDVFYTLRGASAIRGAYDVGLVLQRNQGEREAMLHAESRDVDVESMTLRQAANGAGWEYVGDSFEIERIRAGRQTMKAMLEHPEYLDGLTVVQIAELRKVSEQAVRKQLAALEAGGYVYRSEQPITQMGKKPDVWFIADDYKE